MANKKITELTNLQTPVANSVFVVVDLQNDETKKVTLTNLASVIDTQATANINTVQDNVATLTTTVNGVNTRLGANVTLVTAEDTALQARIAANTLVAAANDFVTFTQLNSNINVVQDNVAGILDGTTFTGEVTMSDDLIVSGNLNVNGDTITSNSINLVIQDRMIMLANSVTGAPTADVGILFNRGNQGNAAFFYDESAKTFKVSDTKDPASNTTLSPVTASNLDVGILTGATVKFNGTSVATAITDNVNTITTTTNAIEARRAANATIMTTEDTALQARITANATLRANEDTALQARITANATLRANEDTALQARIAANTLVAAANDFATFTQLNSNINVVSANVAAAASLADATALAIALG